MSTELLEPVVNDGVRLTHFFNGRVLTAEDLRREQDAARDRHRGLAGAVGEGVVHGLEVAIRTRGLPAPSLSISEGLAFNRDGDPVELPRGVELRLIPAQAEIDQDAGLFALCDRPAAVTVVGNPGFYLLAARPASALSREQVPMVDLSTEGIGSRCGARYAEMGASFSLVPLPLPAGGADAPLAARLTQLATETATLVELVRGADAGSELALAKALSRLRNGMAYWLAGRDAAAARVVSVAPSASAPASVQTPVEALRTAGALASCDVPLALLYVSRRQLEWVDGWAVRRAPVPRVGPDPLPLAGALPAAEAAAAFLQFRDHAASFLDPSSPVAPAQVRASEWFLFLPPAGVLPLQSGAAGGFSPSTFFGGEETTGPAALDAARVPPLLRASLGHAAIDLADTNERAWLYAVGGLNAPGSPPCLLFAGYPVEEERTILPVRITALEPAGEVHVGDPLRIRGDNLEGRIGGQQVLVDGVPVPAAAFLGAQTDDELLFTVPEVPGLPAEGKPALLIVSNRGASAIRPIRVRPRPGRPEGAVDVEFVVAHSTFRMGAPALFRFSVRNRTDRAGTIKLAAVLSEPTWPVRVLASAQSATPIDRIGLAVGEERSVFVHIPVIPTGSPPPESLFTVRLDADFVTLTATSGPQEFKLNTAGGAAPDPGVAVLSLAGSNPAGALQGTLLSVSPYYPVQAVFNLLVSQPGEYTATARFVDAAGNTVALPGWMVNIIGQNGDEPGERTYTVTQAQVNAGNGRHALPLQVALTNYYNAGDGGEVLVRVQRTGQPTGREVRFSVQRTGWIWYYGYL
jgi:hypothetical protein